MNNSMYEHTCLGECVHARLMNIVNIYELELLEDTCLGECVHDKLVNIVNMYEHI